MWIIINHEIRIPIKQPVFHGVLSTSPAVFFFFVSQVSVLIADTSHRFFVTHIFNPQGGLAIAEVTTLGLAEYRSPTPMVTGAFILDVDLEDAASFPSVEGVRPAQKVIFVQRILRSFFFGHFLPNKKIFDFWGNMDSSVLFLAPGKRKHP